MAKTKTQLKAAAVERENRVLTDAELRLCHYFIRGGRSDAECGRLCGFTPSRTVTLKASLRVQNYMETYLQQFREKMISREVEHFDKEGITRNTLLNLLRNIAEMLPERTRGSVEGQVAAVGQMAAIMGETFNPRDWGKALGSMSDEQLRQLAPESTKPQ